MFGHQDNNSGQDNSLPMTTPKADTTPAQNSSPPMFGSRSTVPLPSVPHDTSPASSSTPSAPAVHDDLVSGLLSSGTPQSDPAPSSTSTPAPTPVADSDNDDLLSIKQQALQQLTPLIDQLDQTPEEKFRTTMMMIQAADNRALLKEAYEAAQAITDEKERAQALLDVVNEINYFTQKHDESPAL